MRSMDFDFMIDGQPVPAPDAGVQLKREDVESEASGMDDRGVYHRFVLRPRVKKWTLRYCLLTQQEMQYLQSLFDGKETVTVRYRQPDGSYGSCRAWCGCDSGALVDSQQALWKDFVLTVCEC